MAQQLILSDKIDDGEMDLSMCNLEQVPVKEIAAYRNLWSLDLSNNYLTQIQNEFPRSLVNLSKLDLSRNQLRTLPENFGEMRKLKHLDLYKNELQYLPLSISQLVNLRWLDVKDNPLVPAILEASGDCQDTAQCQQCATNVIYFFTKLKEKVDEQRVRDEEAQDMRLKTITNVNFYNGVDRSETIATGAFTKCLISVFCIITIIMFLLTSVRYERTTFVEKYVVETYRYIVQCSPTALQYPVEVFGHCFECLHSAIGNYLHPNRDETFLSYLTALVTKLW